MKVVIIEGEGAVLEVNLGHLVSHCNQWGLCCVLYESDALFPNYFGDDLSTPCSIKSGPLCIFKITF